MSYYNNQGGYRPPPQSQNSQYGAPPPGYGQQGTTPGSYGQQPGGQKPRRAGGQRRVPLPRSPRVPVRGHVGRGPDCRAAQRLRRRGRAARRRVGG